MEKRYHHASSITQPSCMNSMYAISGVRYVLSYSLPYHIHLAADLPHTHNRVCVKKLT